MRMQCSLRRLKAWHEADGDDDRNLLCAAKARLASCCSFTLTLHNRLQSILAVRENFTDRRGAGYMIVHPYTPGTFRSMYPSGKAYLFDIGAGHWNEGSLTWFVTVWARRGIVFDEIYGATSTRVPASVSGPLTRHTMLCRRLQPRSSAPNVTRMSLSGSELEWC